MKWILALTALGLAARAAAGEPAFDPRAHRVIEGAPTTVMVLGTPHLSGLPAAFTTASLAPLLDRLAAWSPTIITIEAVSGPQCEFLIRYKAIYPGVADDYCWDSAPSAKATQMDVVAATAAAQQLLDAWPATPSAAQRRHLAAVFLASGDRASALVQWLRLPAAERHPGDGIDAALAALLDAAPAKRNENYQIAAALAARLGLERVYQVDDHSADDILATLGAPFEAAMKQIWSASAARATVLTAENAKLGPPDATIGYYRGANAPAAMAMAFDSDFGAALRHVTPEHYGRRYVAWWEVRNLRMVANIRSAFAAHPGARVLSLVGASHKGYFEAYLNLMHDVRLDDVAVVLK